MSVLNTDTESESAGVGLTGMRCAPMSMRGPAGSGPDLRAPQPDDTVSVFRNAAARPPHANQLAEYSSVIWAVHPGAGFATRRGEDPNSEPSPSAAPPSRLFACPVRVSDGRGLPAACCLQSVPIPIPIPKRSARLELRNTLVQRILLLEILSVAFRRTNGRGPSGQRYVCFEHKGRHVTRIHRLAQEQIAGTNKGGRTYYYCYIIWA